MLKNTQSDPRWSEVDMAIEGDRIITWGCFLTSLANIFEVTPLELNDIFKREAVYAGKGLFGYESEIYVDRVAHVMNCKIFVVPIIQLGLYTNDKLILRYKEPDSPSKEHFSNIISWTSNYFRIFDVFDGKEKVITRNRVINIYAVVK